MPTYDYQCDACGHEFEKFQSMTARPIKKCPECGEKKVRRLIGMGAGVIFKGSGFYQTDYRGSDYKKDAEADKSASAEKPAETKKDAPAKTDAKSESKTDSKPKSSAKPNDSKKT